MAFPLTACGQSEVGETGTVPNHTGSEPTVGEETIVKAENDFERKTVMLNSGYEMPINGLGTYGLHGGELLGNHIRENTELYDFELTEDEMARIGALDRNEKHDWY